MRAGESDIRNTGAMPRLHGAARLVMAILLGGIVMIGCGSPRPSGLLGLKWGQNASTAPDALGLQCQDWRPWPGMAPFEVCHGEPVRVLGLEEAAFVTFVRKGNALAGIQLLFKRCAEHHAALRRALAAELGLEDDGVDYRTWRSGEVARVERRGTECMVTVTNGELGKAYQAHRLRNSMPLLGPR